MGETEKALQYLRQSAAIDLSDSYVGIGGGVHIAALGGNWMVAVLGFAGLQSRHDGIALDPKLPADWRSLAFTAQWRGRTVKIRADLNQQVLEAVLKDGEPMTLYLHGEAHALRRDDVARLPLVSGKS